MTKLTSEEALRKLMDGNQRFVSQKPIHPNQNMDRVREIRNGQNPFAMILGCSDSRVPPEIIFDQGLGDIFVIRVAGNILDETVIASAEYAAEHLGVSLLMVLGHGNCGAVTAAIEGGRHQGSIHSLVKAIDPAIRMSKYKAGDTLANAIEANVLMVVDQLQSSKPILSHLHQNGSLKIIGALYDMESGKVGILI